MSSAKVTYRARADATPKREAAALAAVYKFILDRHAEKAADGMETGDEGAERRSSELDAKPSIPR